ncbi:uncharacterized protein MYCFIDRAFT_178832 [Pseudocercospora fijiensis CIRAD86]|uniref:Uncharacterized protein n=1 Tax=Pseudocercospora fijiensis (strain CIRAD86) TaxID=383855 RepID=M2YLW2_PSEFD|nr:uncharacterized protein MYCFIDRAFT_178832 [Pseudocercospora fijiensis CIRAD86]EME78720.1 hypothetical protein MYCFIDRAFT_178832 [Pseudocercospora fijiensis CIRAD86]
MPLTKRFSCGSSSHISPSVTMMDYSCQPDKPSSCFVITIQRKENERESQNSTLKLSRFASYIRVVYMQVSFAEKSLAGRYKDEDEGEDEGRAEEDLQVHIDQFPSRYIHILMLVSRNFGARSWTCDSSRHGYVDRTTVGKAQRQQTSSHYYLQATQRSSIYGSGSGNGIKVPKYLRTHTPTTLDPSTPIDQQFAQQKRREGWKGRCAAWLSAVQQALITKLLDSNLTHVEERAQMGDVEIDWFGGRLGAWRLLHITALECALSLSHTPSAITCFSIPYI